MEKISLEKLTTFCRETGIIFAGSEIYGGLANSWDFGPVGVELYKNVKNAWWKKFVQEHPNNVGLDGTILMNSAVWRATGHIKSFADPMTDCKKCKNRFRTDKLIAEVTNNKVTADGWKKEEFENYLKSEHIKCPICNAEDWTPIRQFSMMLSTNLGAVEDTSSIVYLKPESVQNIFVDFKQVQSSTRKKLPFGIAQIGKAFRNEITPGKFIFRVREFEQMDMIFFCKKEERPNWYKFWKNYSMEFLYKLGIKKEDLKFRRHSDDERCFYCEDAYDIEYNFPWGFDELWGQHDRTDYDLTVHQRESGKSLEYLDPETNEKFIPHAVETSLGAGRLTLVCLLNAYTEEDMNNETRIVLKLHPFLSPYKISVLPLLKKKHSEIAKQVLAELSEYFMCTYDDAGSIGKRYRRQDEIGTPFCLTIDDESLENNSFTIRHRDSMTQERLTLNEIRNKVFEALRF